MRVEHSGPATGFHAVSFKGWETRAVGAPVSRKLSRWHQAGLEKEGQLNGHTQRGAGSPAGREVWLGPLVTSGTLITSITRIELSYSVLCLQRAGLCPGLSWPSSQEHSRPGTGLSQLLGSPEPVAIIGPVLGEVTLGRPSAQQGTLGAYNFSQSCRD